MLCPVFIHIATAFFILMRFYANSLPLKSKRDKQDRSNEKGIGRVLTIVDMTWMPFWIICYPLTTEKLLSG